MKDRPVGERGSGGRKKRDWRRLGLGFIRELGFVFVLSFFRVFCNGFLYYVCMWPPIYRYKNLSSSPITWSNICILIFLKKTTSTLPQWGKSMILKMTC